MRRARPRAPERMTRRELLAEVRRLRRAPARRSAEAARAQAEHERLWLMRDEERLRAAMEAKDEFLAILSH